MIQYAESGGLTGEAVRTPSVDGDGPQQAYADGISFIALCR